MSQKHSSDLVPLATSFGLFLLTTAVTQWIRQVQPRDEFWDVDDVDIHADSDDDRRDWYENRRVQGRLSYDNLHHVMSHLDASASNFEHSEGNLLASTSIEPTSRPSQDGTLPKSEWDLHRQNSANKTFNAAARRRSNVPPQDENYRKSEWDLHRDSTTAKRISSTSMAGIVRPGSLGEAEMKPVTTWKHFEHYNENDRARCMEKLSDSQRKRLENPADQDAGEDSSDTSFNDARSISSEGSGSSEEQFVWMKHSHRQRDSDSSTPWPEILRRKVSGLTLLFENSPSENDSPTNGTANATEPPLHVTHSERPTLPPLTPNDTTVRRRNTNDQRNEMARRTMSSPDLGSPVRKVKRLVSSATEPSTPDDSSEPKAEINNRILRAQYNANIMPEKLVMIRHGQSMGNINELLYSTTPDNSMPLTDLGWKQARESGKILKDKILGTGQSVHFIVSPYVRTVETFHGIVSAWCDPKEFDHIKDKDKRVKAWYGRLVEMGLTWNEDSRIREQDFGNYQDPETIKRAKQERHRFGVFYYRFPHGESASDVFDRVSTFLDSLWRSFEMNRSRNYVLVTHGISIRVLLARYFRYTIDQFNMLANPRNCEMVVLGHNDGGKLELEGRCALEMEIDEETGEQKTNYKFHKRLRILPRSDIRKVRIRISPDDK